MCHTTLSPGSCTIHSWHHLMHPPPCIAAPCMQSCLAANNWDVEAAYDALRKKGLAAAAKKASRHAAEGLVGLAAAPGGSAVAVVEINSETDFVARWAG